MSQATSAARTHHGRLGYVIAICVLGGVFFAVPGPRAGVAAFAGGLVVFTASWAVCTPARGIAAPGGTLPAGGPDPRRHPGPLLGWMHVLDGELTAAGHEMTWSLSGGAEASSFTGTCRHCGGQAAGRRDDPMGDVTLAWPGRVLLQPGSRPRPRRCGGCR
jgi:hypothetical protein